MFFLLIPLYSFGITPKDTVSVMVYNLLFYGHYTSFCTPQNNNVDDKDAHLRKIIAYAQPDLFAVNEMGPNPANTTRLLDNVMNADGRNFYTHASFTNNAGSNLVNMLFYNEEKFVLYDEAVVASVVRDINLYTLYYSDPDLASGNDTIFVHLFVAHFKAGSSSGDQQRRQQEAAAVMGYIQQMNIQGNLLFLGDFNMNSSYEQAYQTITYHPNESIRFYDPIDKPGVWWNNPEMAPFHTQSTRTGQHDCFVTGGMDDRYDFILASESIMEGNKGMKYIHDSYETIGQDGLRFNQSLVSPANQSGVPQNIIHALYNMSDHLPVKMKVEITNYVSTTTADHPENPNWQLHYDSKNKQIEIITSDYVGWFEVDLISVSGIPVFHQKNTSPMSPYSMRIDVSGYQPGVYMVSIRDGKPGFYTEKLIVY